MERPSYGPPWLRSPTGTRNKPPPSKLFPLFNFTWEAWKSTQKIPAFRQLFRCSSIYLWLFFRSLLARNSHSLRNGTSASIGKVGALTYRVRLSPWSAHFFPLNPRKEQPHGSPLAASGV